jgi:antitoxin component YwqK of YwqJK toxin-antitoxin module
MLGYKIAKHGETRVVVTLEIPSDALTNMNRSSVVEKETAKYRANKVKVLKIEDEQGNCYPSATSFNHNNSLDYKVGTVIEEPSYNVDPEVVCAEGIHYFLNRRVAELYGLKDVANGLFERWFDDGKKWEECSYVDGKRHGLYQLWHKNGQKWEESSYVAGKMHGLYQLWYENGKKREETTYVEGRRHGLYQVWHENGKKREETTYVEGRRHGLYQVWYKNGQKGGEITFVAGKEHGLYQAWHENGQKWEECSYVAGKMQGLYQLWNEKGQKWEGSTFNSGYAHITYEPAMNTET